MNLRKVIERFSRGVVFKRRLPPEFHRFPIYVSPEAGLRYWSRMSKVDPMLYRMARELVKPNASVWDVEPTLGFSAFAPHRSRDKRVTLSQLNRMFGWRTYLSSQPLN